MTKIIDQYSLQELQGVDIYGFDVYKARHMKTGQFYTVRNVSTQKYNSNAFFQDAITNEVAMHKKVCHGNLINFVKMFKTANNYYLVYEYCNGGTLYEKVTCSKLTESQQNLYIRQLILAVRQLHSSKLAHLNLNPYLIYIATGGMAKIANFAHAREIGKLPITDYDISKFKHIELLAPQQLLQGPVGFSADIYSLGRIIAFIKYGKMDAPQALIAEQLKQRQPFAEFISSMIAKDPSQRCDINVAKQAFLNLSNKKSSHSPSYTSMKDVSDRKTSDDKSLTPRKSQTNKQINSSREVNNVSKSQLNTLSVKTKGLKDVENVSETKSYVDSQQDSKLQGSEIKNICKERTRYNMLLVVGHQVCTMELAANSPKLNFLIAKKAYLISQKMLQNCKTPKKQTQVLYKTLEKEKEDIKEFYKNLKEWLMKNQKSLFTDSAFELEVQEDECLNQIYLRKQIKEYISAVFPKLDVNRKEEERNNRQLLEHINNLADVQQLDKIFSQYMNDTVVNLLDQVYFSQIERMDIKDLHRFVAQKIS